jgi:hypothetical protein
MLRRLAIFAVLVAAAGLTTVLMSTPATAAVATTSTITQPAEGTHFFVSDSSPPTSVPLVGTTDGAEGTEVDIRCYYDQSGHWSLIVGNVPLGPGGAISTTMQTDRPFGTCVMRAVPVGYPSAGDASAFAGPAVTSEKNVSKTIPSGPNAGKVYDFDVVLQGAHAMNEYGSAFGYGLASSRLQFDQISSNYLWYDNASLGGGDGGRSLFRVDGRNAYGPRSARDVLPDNPGFLPLTYTATRDPATGNVTIRESEPLMVCPTETYPPTAGSCPRWKSAGVRLERSYFANDGGRQVHVTDVWRSTDGKAHTVSAHCDQWVEGADYSSGGFVATPVGVKLPWLSTSFKTFTSDVVYPGPAAGPRSIFVRDDKGAADGDTAFPRGAISFDLPPQKVERKANDQFTLRNDGIAIPAGGKRVIREAFVIGTTQSVVNAKAAANEQRIDPYRGDGLIKKSGATNYLGNNVYNTTGANQTTTARKYRGSKAVFDIKVQNDGTAPDTFKLKGPGGGAAFGVHYYAGTTNITTAVENGTYKMGNLAPGGSRTVRLVITVKSGATIGAVRSWLVSVTSTHDATRRDAVKARVRVIAA